MNMLKKGDVLLIALIVAASLAAIFFHNLNKSKNEGGYVAVIKQGNAVIHKIDLDRVKDPYTFHIEDKYNLEVEVKNGSIRIAKANCPDQLCVKSGWLTKAGDITVCLPNRTMIKVEGVNDSVDGISY